MATPGARSDIKFSFLFFSNELFCRQLIFEGISTTILQLRPSRAGDVDLLSEDPLDPCQLPGRGQVGL